MNEKRNEKEIEALKYAIGTIADIIHMQMPLKYQDEWLSRIKAQGIWEPMKDEQTKRIVGKANEVRT